MVTPVLHLRPHLLARAVVITSSVTILTALLLTHFIPGRFRIHPYPYLSDAGLRDPERIVLSFGLALSAALFVPVAAALYLLHHAYLDDARHVRPALVLTLSATRGKNRRWLCLPLPRVVSCDVLLRVGLYAGILLAFFLAFFTAIPGWFFFHHIFALGFALSSAAWCLSHALFSYAKISADNEQRRKMSRVRVLFVLIGIQALVVGMFGVIWGSVKAQIPYKMIPNKDPRFIMLAILEYLGTAAFLIFIWMVSNELPTQRITLSLTGSDDNFASFSPCKSSV